MIRNVAVGISGGVDSAVAALMLRNHGFNVRGVFMKNWDIMDEAGNCSVESDWEDAQWVCRKLNLPIIQVNFVKEYWNQIFGQFLKEYENGLTPNPDILCNKFIKFDAFFNYTISHLNVDAICTGHYARSSFGRFLENYQDHKNAQLLCALDSHKDQTFFLSQMPQIALRKTMFPLGHLLKENVKQIAREAGLERIARKRESTGLCFVGKRNFQDFISEYVINKPGNFVDNDTGEIIGSHNGIHHFTIGQRCRISKLDKRYFVLDKNVSTNTIYAVCGTDNPLLYGKLMYTDKPHWIDKSPLDDNNSFRCKFRFQHTKPLVNCEISYNLNDDRNFSDGLLINLDVSLRALTPGQYAVFYLNDECLGSARILKVISANS